MIQALSAILTLGSGPDQRGASLSEAGRPPTLAQLAPGLVDRWTQEAQSHLSPAEGLLIPGEDSGAVDGERAMAQGLRGGLKAGEMAPIAERLGHLAGAAQGRDLPLFLCIDARTAPLRALPWELLEALPPAAWGGATLRVLRVTHGAPERPLPRFDRLEVLLWSPVPDDRVCARVLRAVSKEVQALRHTRLLTLGEVPPPKAPGALRILHLVAHGRQRLNKLLLQVGETGGLTSDSLLRWLQPAVEGADLAFLDVCGGATGQVDPIDAPAWRLVQGGILACLAPQRPLGVEASVAFSRAIYGHLSEGAGLVEALVAGRGALSALGLAHPTCRWWNPSLILGHEAVATRWRPIKTGALFSAWPPADADVEAALAQAEALTGGRGFVGVEHLALALARVEHPPPRLALLQAPLRALGQSLGAFSVPEARAPALTPRLQALAGALADPVDLDALLDALVAIPWVDEALPSHARLRASGTGPTTVGLTADQIRTIAPQPGRLTLEVCGGPDDGRRLVIDGADQILGRWDPDLAAEVTHPLFRAGLGVDPTVSRRHLRFLGGARVEVRGATHLTRGSREPVSLTGPVNLEVGDRLRLGAGTRLRVVMAPVG